MVHIWRYVSAVFSGAHVATAILPAYEGSAAVTFIQLGSVLIPGDNTGKVLKASVSSKDAAHTRPTDEEALQWVRFHNIARCMHGSPPVEWDDAVAFSAHEYIHFMTQMVHSDSFGLAPPAGPAGENLYMSTAHATPELAVNAWYEEAYKCKGGAADFTDGCAEGVGGAVTGHFTAMIWSTVASIGCATNQAGTIAICRYKAGDTLTTDVPNMNKDSGNYVGHVLPKSTPASECGGAGVITETRPAEGQATPPILYGTKAEKTESSTTGRLASQLAGVKSIAETAAEQAKGDAERELPRAQRASDVAAEASEAADLFNELEGETGDGSFGAAAANALNAASTAQGEAQDAAIRAEHAARVADQATKVADVLHRLDGLL